MILYPDREMALAAPGDVRVHYKGGIYRKLFSAIDCDLSVDGKIVRQTAYEHLHPHPHEFYVRRELEFNDEHKPGELRFQPVAGEVPARACQTCRFWDRDEEGNPSIGECRKVLPTLTEKGSARWPRTRARDWCGEFLRGLIVGT